MWSLEVQRILRLHHYGITTNPKMEYTHNMYCTVQHMTTGVKVVNAKQSTVLERRDSHNRYMLIVIEQEIHAETQAEGR